MYLDHITTMPTRLQQVLHANNKVSWKVQPCYSDPVLLSQFIFVWFFFRIAGSASVWWTYQIERLVSFDGWQNELFSWWSTFLKVFSPPTSASLSMILKCFQWCLFDWKARPLIWKDGGMSYIGMTSIFPFQCRYVLCAVHQCRKRT